jgi:hypothetical protein
MDRYATQSVFSFPGRPAPKLSKPNPAIVLGIVPPSSPSANKRRRQINLRGICENTAEAFVRSR